MKHYAFALSNYSNGVPSARGCVIKSQTHSLMGKAGVKSRVELLSLFVDEFIDIGATK